MQMLKRQFTLYLVRRTKMFAPHPDVGSWVDFEFKVDFISNQYETIEYKTTQLNCQSTKQYWTKITSKCLLPLCNCWCCLANEPVCHYLDWQNDQHVIKSEIVQQRTVNPGKLVSSKCTVIDERSRVWLDITKSRRFIDLLNEWSNKQKWIASETNESKQIEQRIEYGTEIPKQVPKQIWIENELSR